MFHFIRTFISNKYYAGISLEILFMAKSLNQTTFWKFVTRFVLPVFRSLTQINLYFLSISGCPNIRPQRLVKMCSFSQKTGWRVVFLVLDLIIQQWNCLPNDLATMEDISLWLINHANDYRTIFPVPLLNYSTSSLAKQSPLGMMNYYYFSLSKHRKIKWIVNPIIQKQPSPVGILQNGDLKNSGKLRGKFLLLEACNVARKSLWHRFLQVNIAKFLRTPISKITSVKQVLIIVLKTEFLCKRNFPAMFVNCPHCVQGNNWSFLLLQRFYDF